jgi:two-component system sensor histidine kinase/response regulator
MDRGDVFLVDDNANNLALLSSILKSAGYRVRAVNGSRRALGMIEALPPELILLDVMMPELDGYAVCEQLKQREATRHVPVIFLSALSEGLDKVRAFAVGGVDYVTKPFDAAEVLARVDTQLRLFRLQKDLAERNRELEEMAELKNRFLGMAVHDLRSPLTVVGGYAEFLTLTALSAEQRDFVDRIRSTARYMESLVGDLLDLSAIESGRLQLRLEEVDLHRLVARIVALEGRVAERKEIAVVLEAPPAGALPMVADSAKVSQVLDNLLSNAVKFSPRGSRVTVRLTADDDEVHLSVADEGPGIPAAEQERLFEPFSVTSVRATEGEKSTGLGLAIAQRIVLGHGGRLWAESVVGRGTVFHVTLPRRVPAPVAAL